MSEPPPPIARHEATDRAGKIALRTAHELGAALAGSDAEPVVLRRGGPHRSVTGLIALVDAALADNASSADDAALADDAASADDAALADDAASADEDSGGTTDWR